VEVVASLSQGRTAAAQCGLFTHKSVPIIFEPPCIKSDHLRLHREKVTIFPGIRTKHINTLLYGQKVRFLILNLLVRKETSRFCRISLYLSINNTKTQNSRQKLCVSRTVS
jgi:hypothetical protein